jgi:predicted Holliday junction resolvase-like endonuclease
MNEVLVSAVIVLLCLLLIASMARNSIHKATYRYTEDDVRRARRDAVRGSRLTKGGQIAEHLAPFLPGFGDSFNPKDARFVGHPIDFVVFDGLEEGELRSVVLVEVKSGYGSDLNKRQRQIRRAVAAGNVRFETLRPAGIALDSLPPKGELSL